MDLTNALQGFSEVAALNGDACKSIYGVTLKATERLYSLNTDFARGLIEGCPVGSNPADYQEHVRAQLRQMERTSDYLRDVAEIIVATQAEVFTLGSANAEALSRRLAAEIEKLCLPSNGQSPFSDALHSALSAASSTYEKFIGTSRQITEASLGLAGKNSPVAVKKAA